MKARHLDSSVNIRLASQADLPSIIALERQSASAAHWTEEQYRAAFQADSRNGLTIVAEASDRPSPDLVASELVIKNEIESSLDASGIILGFLIAQQISADWELENMVVDLEVRRRGIGRQLLHALFVAAHQTAHDTKNRFVFLEVRDSNSAARTLYESAGFEPTGRRKSYYCNPLEDAILYRRRLSSND